LTAGSGDAGVARFANQRWSKDMPRLILWVAGLLVGLAAHVAVSAADDAATIEQIKQSASVLDQAFTQQDAALIEFMVTSDHLATTPYYGKSLDVAEQIETLDDFKARLFDVTNEKVDLLGDGAALIMFEKSYEGTFKGAPLPTRVFVSSLWEKIDGKWLQRLYQETAIDSGQ
jgi:hypothetical protein